ncbi:MAG: radical SAM protein [Deltaproteobacteria bacterium]|nr:radical SAM protein [Deltaproteobacteria bacterium]
MRREVTTPMESGAIEAAIAWAEAAYRACDVCPEDCRIDRFQSASGRCGLGADARVYKEYLHFGEERRLVPSHTIYLTGCSFRCAFCSDWDAVTRPGELGVPATPEAVARRIALRRSQGAKNVNFVGGVPDVNVLAILKVLALVPADTHVVWNTNLWSAPALIDHMRPIVGTWLADLKFGSDACALKLARVRDHWRVLTDRLGRVPRERLVVRHLLMPGHLDCCTGPVLRWLADTMPEVPVNLMTGYHPFRLARAARSPMAHTVPAAEREAALALFSSLPFLDRMLDGVEVEVGPDGLIPARNAAPSLGVRGPARSSSLEIT